MPHAAAACRQIVRWDGRLLQSGRAGAANHWHVHPVPGNLARPAFGGKRMKKSLLLCAPALALGAAALAMPGAASAAGSTSYQAQLNALNHSSASGTLTITMNGSQATITEQVTGLADKFGGNPYPHVQHIHIGAR